MKRKAFALLTLVAGIGILSAQAAMAASITGSGSSLVNPLVQDYVGPLGTAFGYNLSYASVGSGTGINNLIARTYDFGASDAPLNATQEASCTQNGVPCVEIPWALTATTVSYNLPGNPQIKLSGPVIAGIFLGTITTWNDPAIVALNPKVSLPALSITAVHRSDGSGDTYAFTDYLQRVSKTFQSQVGNNTLVNWPGGVGESGNSGVAGEIASVSGAVGYISASYAVANHLRVAAVENAAGKFALPGIKDIEAAADASTTPQYQNGMSSADGIELHIVNPPKSAPLAYPISTYSYIMFPQTSAYSTELRKIVYWALTVGEPKFGPALDFAKFPVKILSLAEKELDTVQCPSGGCST